MKSVAIVSLALAGSALARSTIHQDVRQTMPVLNADNELHNIYSMPGNQGNIQFNDYTVQRDAADDELFGSIGIHVKSEVNNMPHNSGTVIINHDDAADNQLDNIYKMPGNKGNIQFNDYSKTHDDELFGSIHIGVHSEVNNMPHNSGTVIINHDDAADNQLDNIYSMPGNQGNIQFNDYTVKRDAADDELFGSIGIHVHSEVNNMPHNSGTVIINHDDAADNELHKYFDMPNNQGNIQFNDYTVQRDAADNELIGTIKIGVKSEVNNLPNNSGTVIINHDDAADSELHNYYSMSDNQGNIQFNDYSKTHDDELFGSIHIGVQSEVNNMPNNSGTVIINHDDAADSELHNYYSMSDNQGNIQFNDYSKTHDDEFVSVAATSQKQKLTHNELEILASLLKLATQDKNGNVIIDGVKIGKIPKQETKKTETPKQETKKIEAPKQEAKKTETEVKKPETLKVNKFLGF